ncbi:uncharacterized protein [Primulina huaijiensis]|uniref:uncharacterized protein n=1 Tax=Primulina huaijiensis TaxID=1492673 RepID=UPI003CC75A55
MGGESTALSDCFGESETWDNANFSGAASADNIFSILEALEESNESFEFQTSSSTYSPLPSAFQENSEAETGLAAAAAFSPKIKKQKLNSCSEIQVEEGQQRTTHITVERNRRKQMNDHLSVLRSLMPCFYVKRGDQASIIGGVVDYIHELKHVLLSLEAKKQRRAYNEVLSPRPSPVSPQIPPLSPRIGLPISPRTPRPSSPYKPNITRNHQPFYLNPASLPSPVDRSPCNSSTSSINDSVNELMASSKSAVAEVEVKFSGPNLLLINTVSRRVPGQVLKIISALEELALEILEVSISVVDETIVLNSFTIKEMVAPRTRAQAALHMRQLTIDNQDREITTLKAQLAREKLEKQELSEIRHILETGVQKNRVPTFDGNPDPEVSHNWLKNVESQLHLLEVPEGLKEEVVTPFLDDRARKWWETVSPSLAEKLNEFENFKQTLDMTVMEYTSRFNDLGTYVPTIMSDETLKMHRFKKGLSSQIQSALAGFKPSNFADLMGAAMSAKTDIKRREEENKNKRPLVSQSAQNGPKFEKPNYSSGPSRETFNSAGNTEGKWCDTCRQKHIGECYWKTGACHRIKEFPDKKYKGKGPNKPNENKTNDRVCAII